MKKVLVLLPFPGVLLMLLAVPFNLVQFRGGIGVIPVAGGVVASGAQADTAGVVGLNVVRGVQPAGQIWVISALKADINLDGTIHVTGQGLLLGGGNAIGDATGFNVFATLICEPVAPFTEHSTNGTGVPLDENGDFTIDDVLAPAPPADCVSPVLLIRNAEPNPVWFAAGIPEHGAAAATAH